MMRIAYFDCFAGISGDMILGALVDLGLPLPVLEAELRKLPVDGYRLRVSRVNKLGLTATKVDVLLAEEGGERLADSEFEEVGAHHHGQDHPHHHNDHGRQLSQIVELIQGSRLAPTVKEMAVKIFRRLGEAEAKVHGVPVEKVHFHEVGGVDAIVDVVGCAIGFHHLGITEVFASPVHLGQGMIRMAHGLYPIPGPATANLLAGVPVYQTQIKGELTTPTGAAVLTAVASGYGPMPAMTGDRVGYGAGTRDREIPNVLRVFLGEQDCPGYHEGQAVMVETNIDDLNPQVYDYLFDRLSEAGALDVYLSQVQMKKNRPAAVLHVLTAPDGVDRVLEVIFTETTTIGVRTYAVARRLLRRETETLETEFGPIRFKRAWLGDRMVNAKPEYDDCKAAAQRFGVPLKLVEERVRSNYSTREQIQP